MTVARTVNSPNVHIVVTCTNRKMLEIPARLRLGNLQERRQGLRFAAWTRRLEAAEPVVAARDLYGGEHWQVAISLPTIAAGAARLWVCSAGYGLVNVDTSLHPYGATFANGTADSVGGTAPELRQWWYRLSEWPGPDPGQPRSFVELARQDRETSIVAILSDAYLRACADDLLGAAAELANSDQLAVIGPPRKSALDELMVPVTARLQPTVGGSLHSLNTRAAAYLLAQIADGPVNRTRLQAAAQHATETAPKGPNRRAPGVRLSDEAVRQFIRRSTRSELLSATALLRQLRHAGMSCEQSRFQRLYEETIVGVSD